MQGVQLSRLCLRGPMRSPEDLLREKGIRPTELRKEVLRILFGEGRPLSWKDTFTRFTGKRVNKVSLYRTLSLLEEKGLVHKVLGTDGAWHYCAHLPEGNRCPGNHPRRKQVSRKPPPFSLPGLRQDDLPGGPASSHGAGSRRMRRGGEAAPRLRALSLLLVNAAAGVIRPHSQGVVHAPGEVNIASETLSLPDDESQEGFDFRSAPLFTVELHG